MEYEYRDFEMWLEGTSDENPVESDIINAVRSSTDY